MHTSYVSISIFVPVLSLECPEAFTLILLQVSIKKKNSNLLGPKILRNWLSFSVRYLYICYEFFGLSKIADVSDLLV